jgi:hypothetical protein
MTAEYSGVVVEATGLVKAAGYTPSTGWNTEAGEVVKTTATDQMPCPSKTLAMKKWGETMVTKWDGGTSWSEVSMP